MNEQSSLKNFLGRFVIESKDLTADIRKHPLMFLSCTFGPLLICGSVIFGGAIIGYYREHMFRTYADFSNASDICRMYGDAKDEKGNLEGVTLRIKGEKYRVRCVEDTQIGLEFKTEQISLRDYIVGR